MIAVAVFDIHMDKNAAAAMKPSTILEGPPPIRRMIKRGDASVQLPLFHGQRDS